jgi:hypothetical protein
MEALALASALLVAATPQMPRGLVCNENITVNAPTQELAEAVLAQAQHYRDRAALRWLGRALPPGAGPVVIHVEIDPAQDRAVTWPIDTPQRSFHAMWITSSRELALGATLAHEMTHVVLATQFGNALPAWANEGAAGQEDDEATRAVRQRVAARWYREGRWPPLRDVLEARRLSPSDQEAYAAAVSLTDYLLTHGDAPRFLAFATSGPAVGWDRAVQQHYGHASVAQLEAAWRTWHLQSLRTARVSNAPSR